MKYAVLMALACMTLSAASPAARLKSELSLTDEQVKKVSAVMMDGRTKAEKKMIDLEREKLNLREEMLKDAPDAGRVKAILDKKAAVEAELAFIKMKGEIDLKGIFSKEQFMQWRGMKHRMEMMKHRPDMPMGRGPQHQEKH